MPDLSPLLDPPDRTVRGVLHIEALAPLSMVSAQPGSYFQTSQAPSDAMLLGMIENALGWHLGPTDRKSIQKSLTKQRKKAHRKTEWADAPWLSDEPTGSESGYVSLLGHHLVFDGMAEIPVTVGYDDLWARLAHRSDDFFGGSRRYDARLEEAVSLIRAKDVKLVSKSAATHAEPEDFERGIQPDDSVFQGAMKPQFPYYYVSPTPRGYVLPLGPYRFGASTTPALSDLISEALADPAAPLYLGSNDGWIHASWEVL